MLQRNILVWPGQAISQFKIQIKFTNYKEYSPSWEADSSSANQDTQT